MKKSLRASTVDAHVPQSLLAKPVRQIPDGDLATLRRKARDCHACGLWKHATQTVFGAGSDEARIVLIGEQPSERGDRRRLGPNTEGCATWHPSAILRTPDEQRAAMFQQLVQDSSEIPRRTRMGNN